MKRQPTYRKRAVRTGCLLLAAWLLLCPQPLRAQSAEIEQLLLNVEKLAQLKSMLEDLKKGYQIVEGGYRSIKDLSEGSFSLHDAFLERLLQVSPTVQQYHRVQGIISAQLRIAREYPAALRQLRASGLLSPPELAYISGVYEGLWKASLRGLEELALVLTSGALRMTEGERLTAIDGIWDRVSGHLVALRRFSDEARLLLLARARERGDITTLQKLYSLKK